MGPKRRSETGADSEKIVAVTAFGESLREREMERVFKEKEAALSGRREMKSSSGTELTRRTTELRRIFMG